MEYLTNIQKTIEPVCQLDVRFGPRFLMVRGRPARIGYRIRYTSYSVLVQIFFRSLCGPEMCDPAILGLDGSVSKPMVAVSNLDQPSYVFFRNSVKKMRRYTF